MFGRKQPQPNVLAKRIRQIADRPAEAASPFAASCRLKQRLPRRALFRNATVETDSGERINVALKDVSETGARIEMIQRSALPDAFWLMEPMLKLERRVHVIWRRGGAIGVAFVD